MLFNFLLLLLAVFADLHFVRGTVNASSHLPDLSNATLEQLTLGLRKHDFTSVDLVRAYRARIEEVNDVVKAVTELNPDALTIAAKLDAERANGNVSGSLHGVPVLLKMNMATMDKMNTTAGSFALLGATLPRDSTVAAKVRAAGGIILGKANMSQWAAWRGNGSNGWSAYGGQCQGVFYPQQDPSGSSSGSGIASALGLAFAALGSETDGSLILPGQASNVVAIKPTVGLTSRSLLIPVSHHQDTIGPIARTVRDAATILQSIAGRDSLDNYTFAQPRRHQDYIKACDISALSGARIGVPRNLVASQNASNLTAFNAAIDILRAAGATVVDNLNITDAAISGSAGTNVAAVLGADFVADLPASYLSKLTANPNGIKSVSDLRNFTQRFPEEDFTNFPTVNTSNWDDGLALGYDNTSPQFWAAYQSNLDIGGRQSILGLLANHSLDALIAPTTSAFGLPALIGTPVINVPLGFDDNIQNLTDLPSNTTTPNSSVSAPTIAPTVASSGATNTTTNNTTSTQSSSSSSGNNNINPVGISFMGAKWSEAKLIGFAYAFEQRTLVREKGPRPYIMPKTQLVDVMGDGSRNSRNANTV